MNGHSREQGKGLNEFNRDQIDDVEPLGGDQGLAVLNDISELQAGHDEFVKDLAPAVNALDLGDRAMTRMVT